VYSIEENVHTGVARKKCRLWHNQGESKLNLTEGENLLWTLLLYAVSLWPLLNLSAHHRSAVTVTSTI